MSAPLKAFFVVLGWLAIVTFLHLWLNANALDSASARQPQGAMRFRVGFLPVT
jgi:hypothetical protein